MSLPRELTLRSVSGATTLVQRPVAELTSLEVVADRLTREPFDLEATSKHSVEDPKASRDETTEGR